jgi:cysteine-rich repeat protein
MLNFQVGNEKCDDGNLLNGDGWSDSWTVEASWVCSGGSLTSADVCTFCTSGFYQNDPLDPTVCVPHCGDGLRVSSELCDDGNTVGSDGCSFDCLSIDPNWVCDGGSATSADIWNECSIGFVPNDSVEPRFWVEVWGDGRRVGKEKCDDGNLINGDGCQNDCITMDENWICVGGNAYNKDKWSECPMGYTNNEDHSECVPEKISAEIEAASIASSTILGAGIVVNGLNSILGNSAPQASLNMVNAVQLLLLLPLIGAYLPKSVLDFIRSMNFSLFNFEFLSLEGNPETKDEISNISFKQDDTVLYLIGLKSGSWMINL